MKYYDISSVPNQKVALDLNGSMFMLVLTFFRGVMYYSLMTFDDRVLVQSERVVNKGFLFPRRFEGTIGGNLCFVDKDDEYPDYRRFNRQCVLCLYDQDEMSAARAGEDADGEED
jgi:hypothetical protein